LLRRPFESSQYASGDYQELLAQHGLRGSMSRRGDCWDNAVAESFFATLKLELVYQNQWPTRAEARTAIFEYLDLFYNRRRRHSSLGFLSPVEFERRNLQLLAA
jgi:transposase InsO family protein